MEENRNLPTPSQLMGAGEFHSWYPGQFDLYTRSLDWYDSKSRFLGLSVPTGCHAKGQGILTYDGLIKNVEDVQVGDYLMGPDSRPRRVLLLVRGVGQMYDVVPVKGDPFRVNVDHILSLKTTNTRSSNSLRRVNNGFNGGLVDGEIRDVCVSDILKFSAYRKHISKLFRVGVDFPGIVCETDLPISPYVLGLLLGDGSLGGVSREGENCSVSVTSDVCYPELEAEAARFDLVVVTASKAGTDALTYRLSLPGGKGWEQKGKDNHNRLHRVLRDLGLSGARAKDKFVPQCYKVSSRENRLDILAGLLDTDGYYSRGSYDFISKSERLSQDVAFLCRSLGLAAYVRACRKHCQNSFEGTYYRVSICGECSMIPCRCRVASIRRQKKSVLHTGFNLVPVGVEPYYGFELDNDGRYLLSDFTVTHNSGKSLSALLLAKSSEARTVILTATKGLQQQYSRDSDPLGGVIVMGQNNFPCLLNKDLHADEGICHDGIPCELRGTCPYRMQLEKALSAKLVITNYSYWLAQTNFSAGLGDVDLLILDEGHQAFGAMENYLTVFIARMDIQPLGISFPESAADQWTVWKTWAGASAPVAASYASEIDAEIKQYKNRNQPVPSHISRSYRSLKSTAAKLLRLSTVSEHWIIQKTFHGYRFVPKWVAEFSPHLFGDIPKVVIMSAILSHRTADYLGIPSNESREWIETPSHFPPENTPIWHIPTARINYRTDDYGSTLWATRIDQIIRRRQDRKGIIFTVSYERAKMLLSRSEYKGIMLTHSTNDVVQVVEQFKRMPAPAVLVSPSVTTGYDFPMDSSPGGKPQYIIIGKIPYPNTDDLVTQARHEEDKEWTSFLAMETLVQSAGRMTRSTIDKTEVIVVDDNWRWWWPAHRLFAPAWFRARVKGTKDAVFDPLF